MKISNRIRVLIAEKGYKSFLEFAEENNISYYLLRKLANNETNSIDIQLLLKLCKVLDCEIGELLVIQK